MRRKDEGGRMKDEGRVCRCAIGLAVLLSSFILHPSSFAQSDRTNEVLRGISDNVGQEVDPNKLIAVAIAVVGLAVLIWVMSFAKQRSVNPKPLNSHGKLIKEIARTMGLKPTEIRQLKTLADQKELCSPLVLLLCPSLLTQAVKENPGAVDRKLLASLARKTVGKT